MNNNEDKNILDTDIIPNDNKNISNNKKISDDLTNFNREKINGTSINSNENKGLGDRYEDAVTDLAGTYLSNASGMPRDAVDDAIDRKKRSAPMNQKIITSGAKRILNGGRKSENESRIPPEKQKKQKNDMQKTHNMASVIEKPDKPEDSPSEALKKIISMKKNNLGGGKGPNSSRQNVPSGLQKSGKGTFRNLVGSGNNINNQNSSDQQNQSDLSSNSKKTSKKSNSGLLSRFKSSDKKNEQNNDSPDVAEALKKHGKRTISILSALIAIAPILLPGIVLIILVAKVMGPVIETINEILNAAQRFGESIVNFFSGKGFSSNETLLKEFEEKVDIVLQNYDGMNRESLKAALYYGFYSFDEYMQRMEVEINDNETDIENVDDFKDTFNYKKLKLYTFTVANQLVYSTVTFDNSNIIQTKDTKDEEADFTLSGNTWTTEIEQDKDTVHTNPNDNKIWTRICVENKNKENEKKTWTCGNYYCKNPDCSGDISKSSSKSVKYSYSCPGGATMQSIKEKKFCENNVGIVNFNYNGATKKAETADYCIDLVTEENVKKYKEVDSNFDENTVCVTVNYEVGTDSSKNKFENFLKYVMIPENYFDKSLPSGYSYSWNDFISKLNGDKDGYNIPVHKIGEGKLDLYSSLTEQQKLDTDRNVSMLLSLIKSANNEKDVIDGRYHIPGAVALPLDFQIKDPIENTITDRVTSGFGKRTQKIAGESTNHGGVDLSHQTSKGVEYIYALLDGVVSKRYNDPKGCGIGLYLAHDIDNDGIYDYYTRYCHMASTLVKEGDTIQNGQKIGIMGSTGQSTGKHLHFEIRNSIQKKMDPVPYLIDIVKNESELANVYSIDVNELGNNTSSEVKSLNSEKIEELKSKYEKLIDGKSHTRQGVIVTAKFLVENLPNLPYFCNGYTQKLIDEDWFKETVTPKSCSDSGIVTKYGLSSEGFINWIFTQTGYGTTQYTHEEFKKLGTKHGVHDKSIKVGDLVYNTDMGIIIELSDDMMTVAYVDKKLGLRTMTFTRNSATAPFKYAILMDEFYNGGKE